MGTSTDTFVNAACVVLIVGLLTTLVWALVRMEQERRHPERGRRYQMTNSAFAAVILLGVTVWLFGVFGDLVYIILSKAGAPTPLPAIGVGLDALVGLSTCALVLRWGFYGVYVDDLGIRSVPEFKFARITRTTWAEIDRFEGVDASNGYMAFMVLTDGTNVSLSGIGAMAVGRATRSKVDEIVAALNALLASHHDSVAN